jgi:hypothetical protein
MGVVLIGTHMYSSVLKYFIQQSFNNNNSLILGLAARIFEYR